MGDASNVQTSFLSGEWSPYAQGRLDDPEYKRGMNVCRNSHPIETGACVRRSGTRFLGYTRNGQMGKMVAFSFSQNAPYTMEFTDGKLRFRDSLGLVKADEPRLVININGGTPAVMTTTPACDGIEAWAEGDEVMFNFLTGRASTASGYLVDGQFVLQAGDNQEQWLLYDAITGQPVDGAKLVWDDSLAVQVAKIFEITTPYTNGSWASLRGVQDEDSILLLHPTFQPYSIFAPIDGGNLFTFNPAQFLDGPYLPPPTDGSFLTNSALTGSVSLTLSYPDWSNTQAYPDGTRFFASTQKRAGLTSTSVQYTAGAVVLHSGAYYVSIQDDNVNHAPPNTTWWKPIAAGAIISPQGFQATDVGRLMRLNSEPDLWVKATAYDEGDLVTYQGAYYTALQATTGNIPGADADNWGVASNASQWTWGIITAINSPVSVELSIQGPDLLYSNNIRTFRLGTYSNSTSWPSCGTFHEDRFWLGGARKNAFDASKSDGNTYDFSPTAPDGTVSDDNAISEVLASPQQNQLLWMQPDHQGIILGTAQGEWLLQSSANNDPITPTSIQAHNVTKFGSANVEPRKAGVSLAFVQRQGKKVMEYVCDLFSSKFAALNLSERAKHLTGAGVTVLAYQQELVPILWARTADNKLVGTTYKRDSMMVSQPPNFNGWHRHDLGSGNKVLDIVEGPAPDGLSDTITLLTQDASGICYVEAMQPLFDETSTAQDAWFVDRGVAPSGSAVATIDGVMGVTLSGLKSLEGQTVSAYLAGLDCGDFLVTNGQTFVPFQSDPDKQFTLALLQAFDATGPENAFQISYTNPLSNTETFMAFPPISDIYLDNYTYLNYGSQAFPDWIRDRVTFMLPGTGPYAGFIQYRISTGAFIQYRQTDYIWNAFNPPYYDATLAYAATPLVVGSDNKIYIALVAGSFGIDPTVSGQKDWIVYKNAVPAAYSAGATYAAEDYVDYSGDLYISLVNANTGNQPDTHPADWGFISPLTAWSATTRYGGVTQVTGNDDQIFWTVAAVPPGQGDPNNFPRNNNRYWATNGSVWPIGDVRQSGFGMDFNGDFYMYQGGNFGSYIKIDGDTLKVKGFSSAAPGDTVPSPSNFIVPLRINDNNGEGQANFILETVDTTPSGSTKPSAVLMSTNGLEASEASTFSFDEGQSPIACSGAQGIGSGSAFVLTRPPSGNASSTSIGMYEINVYAQAAVVNPKLVSSPYWGDPNLQVPGLYNRLPLGQNMRKSGTVAPSDIDPTWTFFNQVTGLIFDAQDGNVMTFFGTENPTAYNAATVYAIGTTVLNYATGSDNNVYKAKATGTLPDPTTDGGVHWTLIGPVTTQFKYLVKLTSDCAQVAWRIPVSSVPSIEIGFPYINISQGYYVFLEALGGGNSQVRRVNTLTGFATIEFPTQQGLNQLGAVQIYNDTTGDIIIYPQYDATMTNPSPAPTQVDPVGGTTPQTFTGWGRWNVQKPSFIYQAPGCVGFTYTSQGQLLRPVAPAETGARNGPAFGKTRRYHRYAMSVANTGTIKIGSDFSGVMRPALFKSRSGKGALLTSAAVLYTGEHSDTVEDDYDLDGMLAWQVTRPVPAVMLALGGMLQTQDR